MNEYLKTVGLSLIPTSLVFIGKSETFFSYLKEHSIIPQDQNTGTWQLYCFGIGVFWGGLVIPVQFAKAKKKLEEKESKYEELLAFNKETYFKTVKEVLKKHNSVFRTRIFVPKKGLKSWWNSRFGGISYFELKNFKGISDPINVIDLKFEVSPAFQGLVGKACNKKSIVVDCQVKPEKYNLTAYQISKTSDIIFCSTAPILNNKDEVVAVLAVDSEYEVHLNEDELKKWIDQIRYYCAFVDKHLKL